MIPLMKSSTGGCLDWMGTRRNSRTMRSRRKKLTESNKMKIRKTMVRGRTRISSRMTRRMRGWRLRISLRQGVIKRHYSLIQQLLRRR